MTYIICTECNGEGCFWQEALDDPSYELYSTECPSCLGEGKFLVKKMTCRERIWSSGDMESCGKPAYRKNLCKEHFQCYVNGLETRKRNLQLELNEVRAQLEEITDLTGFDWEDEEKATMRADS